MEFDSERRYYVYAWKIRDTGEVIYVGKGSGNRYKTRKRENSYFTRMVNAHDCEPEIILDNLTESEAFEYEKIFIAMFRANGNRLTNIQDGGEQPPSTKGRQHSKDERRKISESNKARYREHPEWRKECSDRLKEFLKTDAGKDFARKSIESRNTDEFRRKHSIRCRIANTTPEYLERQSCIIRDLWMSDEYKEAHSGKNNVRAQGVRQYDMDGNLVGEYETITQASQTTGLDFSKISAVCRGRRKTTGGFRWEYTEKRNPDIKNRKNVYDPTKDKSAKPVLQYDLDGNLIREYYSTSEVCRQNENMDRSGIIANLRGRTKSAYGFLWKYKHDDTVPSL